ncbi:MAG TPA: hypothetical protein VGL35_09430 [Rhizomicrobium sp.]|jgi:hypothetical protein
MSDIIVMGLMKRRAKLTHDIEETHERLRQMVVDLENLDATLLQFDPKLEIETIRPRAFRPPKDWAKRGEMMRLIYSVLRRAIEPLTTRDIAFELIVERALDKQDQNLIRLMSKRVGVALRGQRAAGRLRSFQGTGQYMLWEIVRETPKDEGDSTFTFPPKRGFAVGIRTPMTNVTGKGAGKR